jgi:hypothetical protein
MASYLGIFTCYADLPQSFTAANAVGVVAFGISQFLTNAGLQGTSTVQITGTFPNQSVAFPTIEGFQLYKLTVNAILPTTVPPTAAETYIATGIAWYLAANGFPGNCSATLTGTGPTAIITNPTPVVNLASLLMAATLTVTANPPMAAPVMMTTL